MVSNESFIKEEFFKNIDLEDKFFNTLKNDYNGFNHWFVKKADEEEKAFISKNEEGLLDGFLYLKDEFEQDDLISPNFEKKRRLKVGTFKVDAHGTTLGEHFINIILSNLYNGSYEEAYVTIFPKHSQLINLLKEYGFILHGVKESDMGKEDVYIKNKFTRHKDMYLDYPVIELVGNKKFLLSIYPEFHSRIFPYSKLNTEKNHIIEDIPATNSIEKIYIARMEGIKDINIGDLLVIYRTAEKDKSARYSSVATSICTVVEVKNIFDFKNLEEYLDYCKKYSIFTESELKSFWITKKYPYVIKMLYNISLNKRIVRDRLLNDVGLEAGKYWGIFEISDSEIARILELGEVNESFIVY